MDPVKTVHAFSLPTAVEMCRRDHYLYVQPIIVDPTKAAEYFNCLLSNVGAPEAISIADYDQQKKNRELYE